MANRYRLTFKFADTEGQAKAFCDMQNRSYSYYVRKNHPAHYTPWSSQDGTEHKFICWYATR